MTNREFMHTLDDEHFESTMYYLNECDFDLAQKLADPVTAVLAWLREEYDPNDMIWQRVADDNNPDGWEE